MSLWDKLTNARNYARKRRGPDSYFQYKRGREDARRDAEQGRERARDYEDQQRGEEERERVYDDRYTADRESDIAGKRAEREEEIEPDP